MERCAHLYIGSKVDQGHVYLDNYSGNGESGEISAEISTDMTQLKFYPPNYAHLVQPADSFIIYKIMKYWKRSGRRRNRND